jgi:hypothetical protein
VCRYVQGDWEKLGEMPYLPEDLAQSYWHAVDWALDALNATLSV